MGTLFGKRAGLEDNPLYQSHLIELNNELKTDAMRDVGNALVTSLGIGAGLRGLMGLSQLVSGNINKKHRDIGLGRTTATVNLPRQATDEELAKAMSDEDENSGFGLPKLNLPFLGKTAAEGRFGPLNWFRKPMPAELKADPSSPITQAWAPSPSVGLAGDDASTKSGIPLYLPLMGAALAGGLYGGYKLTDLLLGKRQQAEKEDELESAKKRYRHAITSQYTPSQVEKWSSADVGIKLDALYKTFVKQGLSDALGTALGLYGLFGGALALGTGVGTYKYLKARTPEARLKKIIEQRARERWLRSPPEVRGTVAQFPVTSPPESDVEEKAANFVNRLFG